jgi:RHS repeat-associated protein
MWGEVTQTVGTLASDFQYAGYYYHAPSGLNLTTFRAYNPTLGRWINRDPAGETGGVNLYAYVGNDPINNIDPSGLERGAGSYPNNPSANSGLDPGANGASAQSYFYYGCVGICSYYSGSPNPTNPAAGAKIGKCFKNPADAAAMKCDCPLKRYQFIAQGPGGGGAFAGGPPFNFVGFTPGGLAVGGNVAQYVNNPDGSVSPNPITPIVTYSTEPILGDHNTTLYCVICR